MLVFVDGGKKKRKNPHNKARKNSKLDVHMAPGTSFLKAQETFCTRKAVAKSRNLWLQGCFILIFLIWQRFSLYKMALQAWKVSRASEKRVPCWNWTWATLVGGEHSHTAPHCAISASQLFESWITCIKQLLFNDALVLLPGWLTGRTQWYWHIKLSISFRYSHRKQMIVWHVSGFNFCHLLNIMMIFFILLTWVFENAFIL